MAPPSKRSRKDDQEINFYSNPVIIPNVELKWKVSDCSFGLKYSDILTFEHLKWKMGIQKYQNAHGNLGPNMSGYHFYLQYLPNVENEKAWMCQVNGKYSIVDCKDRNIKHTFDISSSNMLFGNCPHKTITTALNNKCVTLEQLPVLDIYFMEIEMKFDVVFYDFNTSFQNYTNIVLSIPDHTAFHFNREVLSSHSKKLYKLLNHEKPTKQIIPLEDIDCKKMCLLLATMCPIPIQIDENNNCILSELAENFDMPALTLKCKEYAKNPKNVKKIDDQRVKADFVPNPIFRNDESLDWMIDIKEWDGSIRYNVPMLTDGIAWKLGVAIKDKFLKLELSISSLPSNVTNDNWLCKFNATFRLTNPIDKTQHVKKVEPSLCLSSSNTKLNIENFVHWDPSSPDFVKTTLLMIKLNMDYRFYNFSSKTSENMNTEINIKGGSVFHFSREILCNNSEFFYNKFYKEEHNGCGIVIDLDTLGLDSYYFSQFLATMCPVELAISEGNYNRLMGYAFHLKVPSLMSKCEIFLMNYAGTHIGTKIALAETYDSEKLMKSCLESFKSSASLKKFVNSPRFENLNDSTKLRIYRCFVSLS